MSTIDGIRFANTARAVLNELVPFKAALGIGYLAMRTLRVAFQHS
jgi:hypothetical protein